MSRFKGIFEQGEDSEEQPSPAPVRALPAAAARTTKPANGKRSDPGFTQVSAYVGRETYRKVRIALVTDGERDFSELVDELLRGWLAARRGL